jgi:hypothetical protein
MITDTLVLLNLEIKRVLGIHYIVHQAYGRNKRGIAQYIPGTLWIGNFRIHGKLFPVITIAAGQKYLESFEMRWR